MSGLSAEAELAAAKPDVPRRIRRRGVNARRCAVSLPHKTRNGIIFTDLHVD
jgi:hypothetical protein